MNQKITIEKVENGYILSWQEEREIEFSENPNEFGREPFIEQKHCKEQKEVIEEDEITNNIDRIIYKDGEKQAMTKLLFRIAEFFGIQYDKFKEDNLKITWTEVGHKINK